MGKGGEEAGRTGRRTSAVLAELGEPGTLEALRQSEEKYRSLYRNTPVMMHSIDRAGRIVSVSDFWLSSLGYEESEVIGRPSVDFLTPESRIYARDVVLPDYFRTGVCKDVPYQFIKKDGTAMDVLLSAIAERDANGDVSRSLAVLIDVTERNRALGALRESEQRYQRAHSAIEESERRYREIFENAGVSLWEEDFTEVRRALDDLVRGGVTDLRRHFEHHPDSILDIASRIRVDDVNQETVAFHGATTKDELLAGLAQRPVPESKDVLREELLAFAEGRPRFASEAVVTTLSGQRRNILMTVVFPYAGAPKARALVSTLDITERKNLENQLRHAQKMEAVGQLAGGIAHDFNNLLAVILGRSEILLGMASADEELKSQVRIIRESVGQASRLTSRLLAFSRQQVWQPRVADLSEIVEETVDLIRSFIGADVEIAVDLSRDLKLVRVDPGQIGQVVLNLALNARDAMPRGGRLSIRTFNEEGGDGEPRVVLEVVDTGHGMDEATRARIFEPFFTTKSPGRGTGLGLAMVHGIVEQSGGAMHVESAPGEGATFSIHLPPVLREHREPRPSADATIAASRGETVLLAEDESAVRAVTGDLLTRQGYQVLAAASAKEALSVAASHDGPIDLLITDVVMPEIAGPELATRLLTLRPTTRVLFISGFAPEAAAFAGAPLLLKPFTATTLLAAVRGVLDEER